MLWNVLETKNRPTVKTKNLHIYTYSAQSFLCKQSYQPVHEEQTFLEFSSSPDTEIRSEEEDSLQNTAFH